ncbi:MAG: protein kinase [Archangium sp.]|nr:protein kinase [Archangium sp.]
MSSPYGSVGPHLSEVERHPPGAALALATDRYRVIGLVGQGGMGRVFSVFDTALGREVALKELLDVDEAAERRLLHEAHLSAQLEHPGIVPIYDVGRTAEGRLFYTMRLVRGAPLRSLLERPERPGLNLVRHVLDAARAVAFAHERSILHRDLKPENVLVGSLGETQVADWGLAIHAAEVSTGGFEGTRRYAAPELFSGAAATAASDVYALGVMLLEVLVPVGAPLELGALPSSVPSALRSIIARATTSSPNDRYRDAGAFARALRDFLDGRLVADHRYAPGELLLHFVRAWRSPLIAFAVALLVGIAGVVARTIELVAERDRATAAEALATARTSELLLQQAHSLTSEGAITEAAEVLARVDPATDSSRRRGLAMALGAWAPPRLVSRRQVAVCQRRVAAEPFALCVEPGEVRLEAGGVGRLSIDAATVSIQGSALVVQTTGGQLQRYRLPGFERELDVEGANYAVEVGGAGALVWSRNPGLLVVGVVASHARALVTPCDGLELAAVVDVPAGLRVFCADGSQVLVDATLRPGPRSAPTVSPPLKGLAGWTSVGADGVIVATASGAVVSLPSGQVVAQLEGRGSLRSLAFVETRHGPLLGVRTDRGLTSLVELGSGHEVGLLPQWATGALSATRGTLSVWGRDVVAEFDVDDVSPAVLRTSEGLIDVAVRGDEVTVGGGNGLWLDWRPSQRRVSTLLPGTSGAIKGVGLTSRHLVAAGVALPGVTWLDRGSQARGRWLEQREMTMRGAGVLADDRMWLIGYGGGPWLLEADGGLFEDDAGVLETPGVPVWLHGASLGDGAGFVAVREDGVVRRFDTSMQVRDEVLVPGARRAVSPSLSAPLIVGDAQGVTLGGRRLGAHAEVTALAVDAAARWLAVGTVDGVLRIHALPGGEVLAQAALHDERISALAFSDVELVSVSWDRSVRRWSLAPLVR